MPDTITDQLDKEMSSQAKRSSVAKTSYLDNVETYRFDPNPLSPPKNTTDSAPISSISMFVCKTLPYLPCYNRESQRCHDKESTARRVYGEVHARARIPLALRCLRKLRSRDFWAVGR